MRSARPELAADHDACVFDGHLNAREQRDWTAAAWEKATPVVEEVVETLLALHLPRFTAAQVAFLKRGFAMESAGDLVGTDPLGRLHLFELKKDAFAPRDVDQLEQYLLGHLFRDPELFREHCRRQGAHQLQPARLARAILGAQANMRMATTGARFVTRHLPADHPLLADLPGPLTKGRYGKLSPREQLQLLHAACAARQPDRANRLSCPDRLQAAAQQHAQRLARELDANEPLLRPSRPVVLWVVGQRFSPHVLERLRQWRRSGLDARPLAVEVRHRGDSLCAHVTRERAEPRHRLEARVIDHASTHHDATQRPPVDLMLYHEATPSSSRQHGGGPLDNPHATLHPTSGTTTIDLQGH